MKATHHEPLIDFAKLAMAIRYHRKKAGLTQKDLAQLACVGKTVVYDIEKGKDRVQLNTLLKILTVLNIQMAFRGPMIETFLREHTP